MSKNLLIEDLINPKIGAAVSTKILFEDFNKRYESNLMEKIKMHTIKFKDNYIIHVLIPSEHNKEYLDPIYYDVIFEFTPPSIDAKMDTGIKNYYVKVFSNCPSWMFTFTYIFAKNDCIPTFVPRSYYSKAALEEPSKERNPGKLFGVDRVIYSAIHHISLLTSFRKNRLDLLILNKMKPIDLLRNIMGQEEKLEQVQYEELKLKLKKEGDKLKEKTKTDKKTEKKGQKLKTKARFESNLVSKLSSPGFTKSLESDLKSTVTGVKSEKNKKAVDTHRALEANFKSKTIKK